MTATVYVLRGEGGACLYVGSSAHGIARLSSHAREKAWWTDVHTVDITHCTSPDHARDVERDLIADLAPQHNVAHGTAPSRPRPTKYPWTEWADGSAWRAYHGTDFVISPTNMAGVIRDRAARTGCQVTALVEEDYVDFQFVVEKAA